MLAPVYAPVVTRTRIEQRDRFRELVSSVIESASYNCRLVLGGDFNGEVGATKDKVWRHVMGPYGDSRRTVGGEELLRFCEQEGLVVADTYTRQKRKATWHHFKYGSEHKLDHFLVTSSVRRWVKSVITLKFSARQKSTSRSVQGRPPHLSGAPWLAHTDHDPVEMHFETGRDWKGEAEAQQAQPCKPDVSRFLGSSAEAARLRQVYADTVTAELNSMEGLFLSWDVVADLLKRVALRVVGPVPKRDHRPWLRGKESELKGLESRVHESELRWRKARRRHAPEEEEALQQRRAASSVLRAAKRRWEACWWDDLASKANEADESGDTFAFWQICRQLGFRESLRRRTGCRAEPRWQTWNRSGKRGNSFFLVSNRVRVK